MSTHEPRTPPPTERSRGVAMVPIAVTALSSLSMGGALGVAIGAANDDFPFGLRIGFAVGALVGGLVYWFALRDRRNDE